MTQNLQNRIKKPKNIKNPLDMEAQEEQILIKVPSYLRLKPQGCVPW